MNDECGMQKSPARSRTPAFGIRHSDFVIHSGIRVSSLLRHSGFEHSQADVETRMTNAEGIPKPESPNE
jgi:hypothetical protein